MGPAGPGSHADSDCLPAETRWSFQVREALEARAEYFP